MKETVVGRDEVVNKRAKVIDIHVSLMLINTYAAHIAKWLNCSFGLSAAFWFEGFKLTLHFLDKKAPLHD
jgi:hypothetical protein